MTPSHWAVNPVKRLVDIFAASAALVVVAPLVVTGAVAVFLSDLRTPLYVSERIGRGGRPFKLFKLRTMVINAAQSGIDTTTASDPRITRVGRWLRKTKVDEFPQFLNVVLGDMSLIGPRPNVWRETRRYTEVEKHLLMIRPGLTDYASIAFADLADALPSGVDPNLAYNQYVRPIKSRLGLHYVQTASLRADICLFWLTIVHSISRDRALSGVAELLRASGADEDLIERARRSLPLIPLPPPGGDHVITALDS